MVMPSDPQNVGRVGTGGNEAHADPPRSDAAYVPERDGYFNFYRDLTGWLMGDPPVGRSVLDERRN